MIFAVPAVSGEQHFHKMESLVEADGDPPIRENLGVNTFQEFLIVVCFLFVVGFSPHKPEALALGKCTEYANPARLQETEECRRGNSDTQFIGDRLQTQAAPVQSTMNSTFPLRWANWPSTGFVRHKSIFS